jgi:hypothetical protein
MTMDPGPSLPVTSGGALSPVPIHPPVAWGAIFAGAIVGVAISMLLTAIAAGLGFTLGFPGVASRESLSAFTPEAGAYAIVVQVLSAMFGGYIAGRMRHVWLEVHGDEAHFRDTAHGLVAWSLMTVAGVVLAATVLAPYADVLAGSAVHAAANADAPVDAQRAANIAAQSSFFIAVGMLLSAFVAAVAARLGGHEAEGMHLKRHG